MSAAPIACMLSGDDFKERLKWIADLNATSLKGSERDDLRLTLTYESNAVEQVRQMIEQERACCPFLSFELTEQRDGAIVTITAPEEAREIAADAFEPFVQVAAGNSGCGCCGAPT